MTKDDVAKLIETKWALQEKYVSIKAQVREKYPTHPPQTEVHRYTSIKQKINIVQKRINSYGKDGTDCA